MTGNIFSLVRINFSDLRKLKKLRIWTVLNPRLIQFMNYYFTKYYYLTENDLFALTYISEDPSLAKK